MKQLNNRILSIATASALVVGVTTAVFAHGGFGPGFGSGSAGHPGMMGGPGGMHRPGGASGWMMSGDPSASAEQQLTGQKITLGITSDQASAWDAYAEAVRGKATLMSTHRQTMFGSAAIAPEQRFAFHQQGLEQMQKVVIASRDLYGVLTPDQQARAGNLVGMRHGPR